MNANLKSCPFCGGAAESDHFRHFIDYKGNSGNASAIYCTSCEADMCLCHGDFPGDSPEYLMGLLVERWNKRTHTMTPQQEYDDKKCWLCGSLLSNEQHTLCMRASHNLARAIEILNAQSRNPTPSVIAIREAIAFLTQV